MDALPSPVSGGDEEWTVDTLITVFRRHRALLLRPVALLLLLAVLYCCASTRRYKATGQIQVQKDSPGAFGLESSVMGRGDDGVSSDSLDYNIMLQTEAGILQSDALAMVVMQDLRLEQTADYFPPRAPPTGRMGLAGANLKRLFFSRQPLEPMSVPLAQAPNRRYRALRIFAGHLKVLPVTGTRLINVSYSDPHPERAAAVVNRLVAELGDFTFRQRFTGTLQGSSWLTGQLAELKRQMQELQAKALMLQRDTGMFGNDASRNVVLERLDSLNQTLAQAESNRILKEAIDRVAATGDPELISSLSGNASSGAVASMTNSLSLVQSLRAKESTLQSELAEDSVRYGPAYPRLGELQAQLNGVEGSITLEVRRLGQRAHTDYLIADREEQGARAAFDEQKRVAGKLNDSVLLYGLAKQEADSSRDIYENLLAKLKQAGVLEGLKASNITVVGLAQVPPSNYPSSPKVPLILAAGAAAGLLLGSGLVIGFELFDNKVRSFEGLERILGTPLLGVLPTIAPRGAHGQAATTLVGMRLRVRRSADQAAYSAMRLLGRKLADNQAARVPSGMARGPLGLAALDKQPSTFAEGLRSLRTVLLLAQSGQPPQVLLVTSCLEGEGKTTLALNLAALLAQAGARVLLVDGDLRKPTLGVYFRAAAGLGVNPDARARSAPGPTSDPTPVPSGGPAPATAADLNVDPERAFGWGEGTFRKPQPGGLGVALTSAGNPAVRHPVESMPNFAVLCGDEVPPFPSELLSSIRMKNLLTQWRPEYDFIVFDSPPVLPVTDAMLLSQLSDATLLVVRHGQTTRQALKRSTEALRKQHVGHVALGIVLNGVPRDSGDFYEYFGYQGSVYGEQGAHA